MKNRNFNFGVHTSLARCKDKNNDNDKENDKDKVNDKGKQVHSKF